MALPSTLKRKGGLFGSSPMRGPFDTPGIGGGMAAQEPMTPAKPKFFGEGGVGRGIAGNIGDFLLQYSGMDPIYAPAMQQRQASARDEQQRQQGLKDWAWKQQEEAKYRTPAQPHRWERNDGSLMELGPDGSPVVKYEDPTPKMMFLADGVGGGRWVEQPRPTAQKPSTAPTTLPKDFNEWDADGDGVPGISAAPTQANVMGRAEYQMFVKSMGQAATDRWLASQGIQVGNH